MKRIILKSTAALLIMSLCLALASCGAISLKSNSEELTKGYDAADIQPSDIEDGGALASFAVKLVSACGGDATEGETETGGDVNLLISPYSVYTALAMTQNGAGNETKAEMEALLGLSCEQANRLMHSHAASLAKSDDCSVARANSLWLENSVAQSVQPQFLQTCVDYFDAEVFSSDFDKHTVSDINSWVKDKTNGMIKKLLEDIPVQTSMYIINALAFEAKWQSPYRTDSVKDGVFHGANGDGDAEFLNEESLYFSLDNAVGMIKNYADTRYKFVALLPNEDVSTRALISSLDAGALFEAINGAAEYAKTALPKFSCEYTVDLASALKELGMTQAFDPNMADFSAIDSQNDHYIGAVLHKTYIELGELGTKAGAVTAVQLEMNAGPNEFPTVTFDRPFVYMIIDSEYNIPLFIGALADID